MNDLSLIFSNLCWCSPAQHYRQSSVKTWNANVLLRLQVVIGDKPVENEEEATERPERRPPVYHTWLLKQQVEERSTAISISLIFLINYHVQEQL